MEEIAGFIKGYGRYCIVRSAFLETKDLVAFGLCGFKSHLPHQEEALIFQGFFCVVESFTQEPEKALFFHIFLSYKKLIPHHNQ